MATGPGTLVDAGFIDEAGKITPESKYKFIQDVKKELELGSMGALFPCGAKFGPYPNAKDLPLEDEKKFPDFHKTAFDTYEKIAQSLNLPGNFAILPICDPLALAAKLKIPINGTISFPKGEFAQFMSPALPVLAAKFGFKTPTDIADFSKKLAGLIPVPPKPEFPIPPDMPVPGVTVDFDKQMAAINVYKGLPLLFPSVIVKFADPGLLLKFAKGDIPGVLGDLCTAVHKLFEPTSKGPPGSNLLQLAFTNVMARWTTAMIGSTAIGETVGTSPQGMAAQPGIFIGTKDPIPDAPPAPPPAVSVKTSSNFIKHFMMMHEGRKAKVYLDSAGKPIATIGIGHAIAQITKDTLGKWPKPTDPPLTIAQIDALFEANVTYFAAQINKHITVDLNQNQYDAIMDLLWNTGESPITHGKLKDFLNNKQFVEAADLIGSNQWAVKQGLTEVSPYLKRLRVFEAELFRTDPSTDVEITLNDFYLKGGDGIVKIWHVPTNAPLGGNWDYYDPNENVPPGP